ncbi:hypothetical protein EIK77_005248 [Talaromyces pinophilus]|nr:hypothetical protein EIK77_005248 [Talaromyces pinophilus]
MDTPIPSPGSHPSLISILTRRLQILNNEILSINETVGSGKLQLNQEEYTALEGASEDLGKRAKDIIDVVHALGKRRANAADGQKLLSTMKSIRADLKQSGKLKHRPTFIRNIQLIFEGPKESGLDSVPVKARKKLTHERCVQLRGLGTNGLILWSATFPPSQWDPNSLPKATFEYVLEFIDTKESQLWPEEIYDILSVLSKEEPLRNLPKFQEFFDRKCNPCLDTTRLRGIQKSGMMRKLLEQSLNREQKAQSARQVRRQALFNKIVSYLSNPDYYPGF